MSGSTNPAGHPPSAPWLITGASGFLGRHLLEAAAREPRPLACVALLRDPGAWTAMSWTASLAHVRPLAGSVLQPDAWQDDPLVERLGGICHLAALVRHSHRDEAEVVRTNVQGTLAMVRLAATRRCRLIFVSTSGTVGCFRSAGSLPDEDAPFCEKEIRGWPYYRSKLEAERQAGRLAAELGVELVIVRPPVLLGPGDHRARSSEHVRRLLQGKVPFVIRGGMHFADVRDVAAALLRVMRLPRPRPIYHLPGTICTIQEFYGEIAELAGRKPPNLVVPYRPAWLLARLARGLGFRVLPEPALIEMASHHWGLSSRYAGAELGYHARPGRDTLRDTLAWLGQGA